ncbi:uncharacterized protein PGTG_00094 [Puccinia graminis f. sp. tritici CRL 75-36-700-3]|uniref:Deacetylase sirtuin-type domain-containing protein n=1 Tax=Puccinia graminis f. sp. tritici (strain CRL 75-36-700-3 / race SCCL) TaxID=418459 RepID=E3JQ55_PUCGT|nr:uncharacterized protein PGTG_00094 [Puccinia graminis f. sp. tritici CRL 75-36-700-3]EFP74138.1 hypothetical protein PGTG_00094 [Puccinia graminis f. sp. tritici CRL 75-36-700-3]
MSPPTQLVVLPGTRQTALGPLPSFVKPVSDSPEPDLQRAIKAVLNAKKVAVVVGAGISTAANIPDFRSSTGLFASLKARFPNAKLTSGRDLFDVNAWKDPDTLSLHFGMLAELHKMCGAAQPTAFHQFLKRLDDDGKLSRVYTQNIDGLEEKVGLTYGIPGQDEIQSHSSQTSRSRRSDPPSTPRERNLKRKRDENGSAQLPPTPRSTPPPSQRSESEPSNSSNSQSELDEPGSSQLSTVSTITSSDQKPSSLDTPKSKPRTRAVSAAEAAEAPAPPRPTRSKPVDPFPRVIPLHGTLKNLSCLTCKHSVLMSDYIGELAEGEPILCPQCQSFDNARAISGFRTRGVGLLKSGVVLYGEEHNAGDQVGAVTSRDLMRGRRPDLLIVAGTSLKVPGTKRLVKELSKVIRPPTKTSSVSGDEEQEEEESSSSSKKPAPIHTIFLNNEFPSPCGIWKETFDVWVKGNVDQFIQLVDEERKVQEELKTKKAQEKLERERKKEEKLRRGAGSAASQPSSSSASSSAVVPEPSASAPVTSKARTTTTAPATKPKKLILKVSPQSTSAKSAQPKPSVAGYFKTGKASVVASKPVVKINNLKNPTTIKISNKLLSAPPAPAGKPTPAPKSTPATRKKKSNPPRRNVKCA